MDDPGLSLTIGARALLRARDQNVGRWAAALAVLRPGGTVWATGIGKSGLVAQKLASTLSSFGRRSAFLHPVEAMHGDAGTVLPGDVIVAVSASGRTAEVLRLVGTLGIPVVAVCVPGSPLAAVATAPLAASVSEAAGGSAPVTSFGVACALVDALALALRPGDELHHPGGFIALGRRTVGELMRPAVVVAPSLPVVSCIPRLGDGAVLVEGGGIFTDGDLRRVVGHDAQALSRPVGEVCTRQPVTVRAAAPATEALDLMERRPSQLSVLPVTGESGEYVGLLRLHDLVRAGMGA